MKWVKCQGLQQIPSFKALPKLNRLGCYLLYARFTNLHRLSCLKIAVPVIHAVKTALKWLLHVFVSGICVLFVISFVWCKLDIPPLLKEGNYAFLHQPMFKSKVHSQLDCDNKQWCITGNISLKVDLGLRPMIYSANNFKQGNFQFILLKLPLIFNGSLTKGYLP